MNTLNNTMDDYIQDADITGTAFVKDDLTNRHFDGCRFTKCICTETDLGGTVFEDCTFSVCDIVIPRTEGLVLRNTVFSDSRLMGFNFGECSRFGFSPEFKSCVIDSGMFVDLNMTGSIFDGVQFRNTDFMRCDFKKTIFDGCRFEGSHFSDCDLREADFREASGYDINPTENKIKGSKYRMPEALSFFSYLGIELEL